MAEKGIEVEKMYYTGFCSQGDGASFDGRIDDWPLFLRQAGLDEKYPATVEMWEKSKAPSGEFGFDLGYRVRSSGRYSHSGTMGGSFEFAPEHYFVRDEERLQYEAAQILVNAALLEADNLETDCLEILRGHADTLYKRLEEEYEYQTDDEQVLEGLISNDCLLELIEDIELENQDEDDGIEESAPTVLPAGSADPSGPPQLQAVGEECAAAG